MKKATSALVFFASFSLPAESKCVDPGACYTLSGEIVSCEERETEERRILMVGTAGNVAALGACPWPSNREAADWEKNVALAKFRKAKSFVVYPTLGKSCDTIHGRFDGFPVAESCCDIIPLSVECSLKLDVLRIED